MIKQVSNNMKLIDDKELKKIIKSSYDKGVVFGIKNTAKVILGNLNEMTTENFDEVKERLTKFCVNVMKV